MKTLNCILTGVGGQGTVLASKLIAQSAMNQGMMARTAETIGMAQRGGCVTSHVRAGEKIYSPMIPLHQADLIIGFEPAEAVRAIAYLKKGGVVIVGRKAIKPVTASLSETAYTGSEMLDYLQNYAGRVFEIDTEAICKACGSAKVVNVSLLGAAAASGALGFTADDVEQTIRQRLPEKFIEINLKALHLGAETVLKGA